MNFILPRVYPITDRRLSGLSHLDQTKALIAAGARFIQLREKSLSPLAFYLEARECVCYALEHDAEIIINDRVDIAVAAGARGVHLGQDDLPPEQARQILGSSAIIGYSTHNAEQAAAALTLPIDYIGAGPFAATQTKGNPDPVIGARVLAQIRVAAGSLPIAAIGGINEENVAQATAAGADSVAVIGALFKPSEINSDTAAAVIQANFLRLNNAAAI
jgi:thiamine-phosphate pyrophosphorylase